MSHGGVKILVKYTRCLLLQCLIAASCLLAAAGSLGRYNASAAELPALSLPDQEALALGRKVLAVKEAIQNPTAPGALDAILALGLDSRYYLMVRGWLSMQLQGDQSIIAVSKAQSRPEITARITFLQQAIRAIDLE